MAHWNTDNILSALQAQFPQYDIEATPQTANVFSDDIRIEVNAEETIHIVAFNDDDGLYDGSNDNFEYCSLMDGQDDQGGLSSDTPEMISVYHACKVLLQGMGFEVVRTYESYF